MQPFSWKSGQFSACSPGAIFQTLAMCVFSATGFARPAPFSAFFSVSRQAADSGCSLSLDPPDKSFYLGASMVLYSASVPNKRSELDGNRLCVLTEIVKVRPNEYAVAMNVLREHQDRYGKQRCDLECICRVHSDNRCCPRSALANYHCEESSAQIARRGNSCPDPEPGKSASHKLAGFQHRPYRSRVSSRRLQGCTTGGLACMSPMCSNPRTGSVRSPNQSTLHTNRASSRLPFAVSTSVCGRYFTGPGCLYNERLSKQFGYSLWHSQHSHSALRPEPGN